MGMPRRCVTIDSMAATWMAATWMGATCIAVSCGVASGLFAVPFASAQGCGPTRLKVNESVVLDMTPARAWALVGNFQDLSWDVTTVASRGSGGNAPDTASRTVTLRGGAVFGESLYKYDATAMTYSYHIDTIDVARLPVQNVSTTIEIVPEADGTKSLVRWRSAFYRNLAPGEPAPDLADANAAKAMSAYLRESLEGLAKKGDAKT